MLSPPTNAKESSPAVEKRLTEFFHVELLGYAHRYALQRRACRCSALTSTALIKKG